MSKVCCHCHKRFREEDISKVDFVVHKKLVLIYLDNSKTVYLCDNCLDKFYKFIVGAI